MALAGEILVVESTALDNSSSTLEVLEPRRARRCAVSTERRQPSAVRRSGEGRSCGPIRTGTQGYLQSRNTGFEAPENTYLHPRQSRCGRSRLMVREECEYRSISPRGNRCFRLPVRWARLAARAGARPCPLRPPPDSAARGARGAAHHRRRTLRASPSPPARG